MIPLEYIPIMKSDQSFPCGYFDDREESVELTVTEWINKYLPEIPVSFVFETLLQNGFRRSGNEFYRQNCKNCSQCTPIRLEANKFRPSKSQRHVLNKNQDIKIKIEHHKEKFVTPKKAFLFREYDYYHNHKEKMTLSEAKKRLEYMHSDYDDVYDMEYYLGRRLIAVGMVDLTTNEKGDYCSLSSNYFYYDVAPEILKRSIGVFSVLTEIQLCLDYNIPYYYLGLYLPDCRKMNYKTNYQPYELFENGTWELYGHYSSNIKAGRKINAMDFDSEMNELSEIKPLKVNEDFSFPYKVIPVKEYFEFPEPENSIIPGFVTVSNVIPPQVLISAYYQGVFPWFNEDEGQPVIWQSPDPRFVIFPENFHISKSTKKFLKNTPYTYTYDKCFDKVMENCRIMTRQNQNGTWIGQKMQKAYGALHKMGYAHSFEVWHGDKLAGGFYGILLGQVFIGESMFTLENNSSKSVFTLFAQAFFEAGGKLIDCEAYTDNMARYGAVNIGRKKYLEKAGPLLKLNLEKNFCQIFENKIKN